MPEIDTSSWQPIGETSNIRYYEIEPHIIAAVPHQGSSDTGATARENIEFQMQYLRQHGQTGVVIVFFDRMTGQDSEARRLYGQLPDIKVLRGTGLVGGTMLGRAIGTFFLGVARPRIPVQLFSSVDEAVVWARSLNGAASGAASGAAAKSTKENPA
jgi:hypothetical protein